MTGTRRGAATGLLVLATLLAGGPVRAAVSSGVYSNVCMDADTGDQDGIEIQVRAGEPLRVTFSICEGGCRVSDLSGLTASGHTLRFTVTDQWVNGNGSPAPSTSSHYVARITPGALFLTSPDQKEFGRWRLRRRPWKLRSEQQIAQAGDVHMEAWPRAVGRC